MTNLVSLMLAWEYGQLTTNTTFLVYMRTNITAPSALYTNVVGTNTSVLLSLQPGVYFFNVAASNVWGTSMFSQTLELPEPPTENHCIEISKP